MIINGDTLLSVNETDLDARGTLRIPDGIKHIADGVGNALPGLRAVYLPDSMNKINGDIFCNNPDLDTLCLGRGLTTIKNSAFSMCPNIRTLQIPSAWHQILPFMPGVGPNLTTIIRCGADGMPQIYPVSQYRGKHYHELGRRSIAGIKILNLVSLKFNENGICGRNYTGIQFHNHTYVESTPQTAMDSARRGALLFNFRRELWIQNIRGTSTISQSDIEQVLSDAAQCSLSGAKTISPAVRRQMAQYCEQIPMFVSGIKAYLKKYNICTTPWELTQLSLGELARIVMPITNATANEFGSCTKLLKHKPINNDYMYAIVAANYKNPGAFPYDWLRTVPKSQRGAITKKLHEYFRNATTRMYSPDNRNEIAEMFQGELKTLATNIQKLIKQPVKIGYLGSGNFTKAYRIIVPGAPDYVWKIYHCDRGTGYLKSWAHDTELQNSFLVGGKKYHGKIHFRKMATAGISHQRGEKYLIYPYSDGTQSATPRDPYGCFKRYQMFDFESGGNCNGNTLTDCGAIRINYQHWSHSYMTKIVNTVIYQGWDDLSIVLRKYTAPQIAAATEFISARLVDNIPHHARIRAKIDFLNNKIRTR